jgi:hypothetical protein
VRGPQVIGISVSESSCMRICNGAAAGQIGVVQSRAQLVSRPVRGLSEEMMGIIEGPPARN